jgi:hypothetical protein
MMGAAGMFEDVEVRYARSLGAMWKRGHGTCKFRAPLRTGKLLYTDSMGPADGNRPSDGLGLGSALHRTVGS